MNGKTGGNRDPRHAVLLAFPDATLISPRVVAGSCAEVGEATACILPGVAMRPSERDGRSR